MITFLIKQTVHFCYNSHPRRWKTLETQYCTFLICFWKKWMPLSGNWRPGSSGKIIGDPEWKIQVLYAYHRSDFLHFILQIVKEIQIISSTHECILSIYASYCVRPLSVKQRATTSCRVAVLTFPSSPFAPAAISEWQISLGSRAGLLFYSPAEWNRNKNVKNKTSFPNVHWSI